MSSYNTTIQVTGPTNEKYRAIRGRRAADDLTVMMARALIYERQAGTLIENDHPDNACPAVPAKEPTP